MRSVALVRAPSSPVRAVYFAVRAIFFASPCVFYAGPCIVFAGPCLFFADRCDRLTLVRARYIPEIAPTPGTRSHGPLEEMAPTPAGDYRPGNRRGNHRDRRRRSLKARVKASA